MSDPHNPEAFSHLLRQVAGEVYDTANRTDLARVEQMSPYFLVDFPCEVGRGLLTTDGAIEYHPIAENGSSCIDPILTFFYDGLGGFKKLEYWTDNNAINGEVHTITPTDNGDFLVTSVKSDTEYQIENAIFSIELEGTIAEHYFPRAKDVDENTIANYLLEKEMTRTNLPPSPSLIAKVIPMLRQASADLTYLTNYEQ